MEKEQGAPLRDGLSPTVEPVPVSPLRASIPNAELLECLASALERNADAWALVADFSLGKRTHPPTNLALDHIRQVADDYLRASAIRAVIVHAPENDPPQAQGDGQ